MMSLTRLLFFYLIHLPPPVFIFFFFNDTATTEIYTLSLHDALPICRAGGAGRVHEDRHAGAHRRVFQPDHEHPSSAPAVVPGAEGPAASARLGRSEERRVERV